MAMGGTGGIVQSTISTSGCLNRKPPLPLLRDEEMTRNILLKMKHLHKHQRGWTRKVIVIVALSVFGIYSIVFADGSAMRTNHWLSGLGPRGLEVVIVVCILILILHLAKEITSVDLGKDDQDG